MDEFKDIGRDLWKNKPLLIALAIAAAVVAYILVKNSQNQLSASVSPTTMATGSTLPGSGATYVENSYSTYAPQTTNILPALAPVTTTGGGSTTTTGGGGASTTGGSGSTSTSSSHGLGTTFLGPTGVKHYVAQGGMTLRQIASKFGLSTWNSIYSIPDNQKVLGKLSASSAAVDQPTAGTVLTLPSNTSIGF